MPFIAPKATLDMVAAGSSLGILGAKFSSICGAVAQSCATTFILPATVVVTATGVAGAGMVGPSSPMVGPVPAAMATFMNTAMVTNGLVGADNLRTCLAISTGVILNLATLIPFGISPGVGVGTGTAKVVGFNNAAFFAAMVPAMASVGNVGIASIPFSRAMSDGICLYLNTVGIIPVVSVVGAAGPAPAAAIFSAQFL